MNTHGEINVTIFFKGEKLKYEAVINNFFNIDSFNRSNTSEFAYPMQITYYKIVNRRKWLLVVQ